MSVSDRLHADDSSPPGDRTSARLWLLLLALIWGVNFPVVKAALAEIPPLAFNALRFPLGVAALLLFLRGRGPLRLPAPRDRWTVVALGVLGHVVYQLFFIIGMDHTRAGNASLMLATTPIWTSMLSVGLGHEVLPRRVWLGAAGTVAGMAMVVVGAGDLSLGGPTVRGDVLMALAAVGWSFYTVGGRSLVHRYGALEVTAWTMAVGAVGVVLVGLPDLRDLDASAVPPAVWLAVVYAGLLSLSAAYVIWYTGVRRLGNTRTAVYSNLVPVVALVTAWIWLGERPLPLQIAGAAVILGSITLTRSSEPSGARRKETSAR